MNTVHSISIDAKRRLYVADRANSRIQVFDENGKFLDVWPNIKRPYYTMMSQDQHLWIADGITQKFLKFDLDGRLIPSATWGTFGAFPGGFWGVHQFHVDSEGNLYTADVHVGRPQKFKPKPGVDKARLIGPMFSGRIDPSSLVLPPSGGSIAFMLDISKLDMIRISRRAEPTRPARRSSRPSFTFYWRSPKARPTDTARCRPSASSPADASRSGPRRSIDT